MTLYKAAVRHAWLMLAILGAAILFVGAVDQLYGHSTLAFAAAIIGLVIANRPMLRFNCPRCGKNAFFRGIVVVLWPNRECTRCGLDLARSEV